MTNSKNVTIEEYESAEFVCSIEQNPKSSLTWMNLNSNTFVKPTEIYEIEDRYISVLKIEKVTRFNSSAFICFINNKPNKFIKFDLTVNCKSFKIFF